MDIPLSLSSDSLALASGEATPAPTKPPLPIDPDIPIDLPPRGSVDSGCNVAEVIAPQRSGGCNVAEVIAPQRSPTPSDSESESSESSTDSETDSGSGASTPTMRKKRSDLPKLLHLLEFHHD